MTSSWPEAIALNGRFSGTAQATGTQTAAFGLFDAIVRAARERPVIAFADPRFEGVAAWTQFPNTRLVPVPFQDWSRHRAQLWEQFAFPYLSRKSGCVIAHHPITTCPAWQAGLKTVVTVHDLNFYRHPEWYSRSFRLVYRCFALPGIHRAHRVVAISDYVRRQIPESLRVSPDRVRRIYNGVKPMRGKASDLTMDGRRPYILCVGSLQPHKNLARLIRAHQRLRAELPEMELWVVGRPQPRFRGQPELTALLKSPGLRVLGYLSDAELETAYRNAQVFCYPSLEEGFGLPLLEAMQAGTLTLTSNVACLPEIAGPASELVDPYSESAILEGLRKLTSLSKPERQQRLERGARWAAQFEWQKAAREYLALYEELLSPGLPGTGAGR